MLYILSTIKSHRFTRVRSGREKAIEGAPSGGCQSNLKTTADEPGLTYAQSHTPLSHQIKQLHIVNFYPAQGWGNKKFIANC